MTIHSTYIMKKFATIATVLFFSGILFSHAQDAAPRVSPSPLPRQHFPARLGPDVAVMEIQVGKEKKKLKRVVIGLYDNMAPQTVANFKELINKKFYDGIRFHRLIGKTLVQTGDPLSRSRSPLRAGTGGPGYTLPAEIRSKIGRGALAMARLPDTSNPTRASNGSQFFVLLTPSPSLEGRYTVFGEILDGLDELDEISTMSTDSNDFPLQNISIRSMIILPRSSPEAAPQVPTTKKR